VLVPFPELVSRFLKLSMQTVIHPIQRQVSNTLQLGEKPLPVSPIEEVLVISMTPNYTF